MDLIFGVHLFGIFAALVGFAYSTVCTQLDQH